MAKMIQLNEQLVHLKLGGVIQQSLTPDEIERVISVTVSIRNDIWYGNFTVPMAVGFSTPISILQGGFLVVVVADQICDRTFSQLYQQWSSIFSGRDSVQIEPVHKVNLHPRVSSELDDF